MNTTKELQKNTVDQIVSTSTAFKLLSDPTRLKILYLLFENKESLCVYEIADGVGISQSAASHQLAKLEAHNIVESFREGQTVCYCIRKSEASLKIEKVMRVFRK